MIAICMRTNITRVSLCMALALSSVAVEAQTGKALRIDSAKHVGESTSIAANGPRTPVATGGTVPDSLLGGPPGYDDAKLASFGAPEEMPAPHAYEKFTDIPPTPTERLALASVRASVDRSAGVRFKVRRETRAARAADEMPAIYPADVYSQGSVSKLSVYSLPW